MKDLYNESSSAYDAWFRAKVQEALEDPRPPVSNEEVKAMFAAKREALLTTKC